MPSISQILAASYPAVVNAMKKPANQFAESAFMKALDEAGAIKRVSFGTVIEHTLDYQRNPGASFLASDLEPTSLTKTEVLTAAQFDPGQLSVPIVWSKADEAKNPSENQKVALVKSLLENAITSHDDLVEEALFDVATDGFLGLQSVIPDSGQGSVGGIDASTDVWWRNYSSTYAADGSNIEAQMSKAYNTAAKGTGGSAPSLLVSDGDTQGIFEGSLTPNQRFVNSGKADAGFTSLAYKNAKYVFSQYGNTRIYFLNPKHLFLNVSKEAYRQLGETIEIPNANGFVRKIYTMIQLTTPNKSRLSLLTQA